MQLSRDLAILYFERADLPVGLRRDSPEPMFGGGGLEFRRSLENPMGSQSRFLIAVGIVLIVLGVILSFSNSFSFFRLGRLPGDIVIKRDNFRFYFPLTTSILLSMILTLLIYLLRK